MQLIVKCPSCDHNLLARAGSGISSEVVVNETKQCPSCGKKVDIQIKIKATVAKESAPEKAEAKK